MGKKAKSKTLETPEVDKKPQNGKINGLATIATPRRSQRKISENSVPEKTEKLRKISESEIPLMTRRRKASENSLIEENPKRKISESSEKEEQKVTGTKRKNPENGKTEAMSVADRIKLLSHDQNQKSTPPRTDSVLQLLLQGLNSKDKRILESVLERADEELINNTVKRLPIEAVIPLLEVLQHYIQGKISLVFAHGKWLKAVLQHHTSHVMSSPEAEDILSSMNAVIASRTRNYNQILQLRGKLEMMVQQVTAQPEAIEEAEANKEALLVYHDDSSDELNDKLDDMLMPASDTDNDDWDEQESDNEDEEDNVVEVDSEDEVQMVNGVSESEDSEDEDMDAD